MGGRGSGKTRTGAEWTREQIKAGYRRGGMIAPTARDVRKVMIEGESGLLAVCHPSDIDSHGKPIGFPDYQPSKSRVVWPNGAQCDLYSAEEPERLRGPQHEFMWGDEIGAWAYPQTTWDMAMFGLRLGVRPKIMATTTPRPIPLIKMIVREPTTVRTHSTSSANRANLAPAFISQITRKYEGTRLGRQELGGELLEDVPGAIFTRAMIEKNRVTADLVPQMRRVVVAIDPSGATGKVDEDTGRNDIGIVVAGLGMDGNGYIFKDATLLDSPKVWGATAVRLYKDFLADRIVAEQNFGGGMVEFVIRAIDPMVSYRAVTASRGKTIRAEPVAALQERNMIKYVGAFPALEDELCNFTQNGYVGESSPNRADAMVWAITDLMLDDTGYVLTASALS